MQEFPRVSLAAPAIGRRRVPKHLFSLSIIRGSVAGVRGGSRIQRRQAFAPNRRTRGPALAWARGAARWSFFACAVRRDRVCCQNDAPLRGARSAPPPRGVLVSRARSFGRAPRALETKKPVKCVNRALNAPRAALLRFSVCLRLLKDVDSRVFISSYSGDRLSVLFYCMAVAVGYSQALAQLSLLASSRAINTRERVLAGKQGSATRRQRAGRRRRAATD